MVLYLFCHFFLCAILEAIQFYYFFCTNLQSFHIFLPWSIFFSYMFYKKAAARKAAVFWFYPMSMPSAMFPQATNNAMVMPR